MPATASARRPRRRSAYALLLLLLGSVAVLSTALAPSSRAQDGTRKPSSEQVTFGKQLFLQSCASCHGLNAEGGNRAPSLIGVGAAAVDFQVGTGRMPLMRRGPQAPRKPPTYSQGQIDALAAYVASLAPGPAVPSNLDYQQGDLAEGGSLFRSFCAQCHNIVGAGGALTYGKYAPSLDKAIPKQIYEAMITGPESMPVFSDQTITPSQKLSIIKYVRTIQTEANPGGAGLGRVGPVTEGAVAWLVGIGLLVGITLWIGQRA